ncbi:MAG TPA: hypothetical protein VGL18_09270, partial [Actinomycetota bacterium]
MRASTIALERKSLPKRSGRTIHAAESSEHNRADVGANREDASLVPLGKIAMLRDASRLYSGAEVHSGAVVQPVETKYAWLGRDRIAYQVLGEGPPD